MLDSFLSRAHLHNSTASTGPGPADKCGPGPADECMRGCASHASQPAKDLPDSPYFFEDNTRTDGHEAHDGLQVRLYKKYIKRIEYIK